MFLRPQARRHVWVLLSYGLLSFFLTFPLVLRFSTHVPGDGIDDPALAWNLWWVRFSILEQQANPFACRWMFWPIGINLAFYTLTVWNGLLSIPLQVAWGIVPASNVLLLLSFVLGGYGTFLLTRQIWGDARRHDAPALWLGAWLAGLIYAFASNKLFYAALGQFNIASSQWIPFCVLYTWRLGRPQGRPRDAVLAGLFLGLQAWAEATFASFLLIFVALYGLWLLTVPERRRSWLRWGARFAVMLAVFAVILAPMLANMVPDLRAEGDFFTSGGGFADVFSADLAGYLMPTLHHPFFGQLVDRMPFPHDKGQQVYLGYSVLALALLGVWMRPRRIAAFWGVAVIVFFLLTLGPTVRWMGEDTGVPGPFALVSQLPFFKGNRYPSRYVVMLLLAVSVLAGRGMMWLRARFPAARAGLLVGIASLLFLLEHVAIPLPLSDMRVPAVYREIAAEVDPTPGVVMELPLGWRNGARVVGKKDTIIMAVQWYQTVHHRPILGGNTSRNPEFKFQYFSEAPLLDLLIGMVNAADEPWHEALRAELAPISSWASGAAQPPPAWLAEQRAQAARVLNFLDIAYVVVHRSRVPKELAWYVDMIFPVQRIREEGDLVLYRVRRTPEAVPTEFNLVSDLGHLLLGEGWSPPDRSVDRGDAAVWAQRREVRLQFPVYRAIQAIEMRVYAPEQGQEVTLLVNGQEVGRQAIPPGWSQVRFAWPASLQRRGLVPARLRFERLYDLAGIPTGAWVGPDGRTTRASVLVRSAGEEVGNFAHIYVNGVDRSLGQRGYNLVQFDPDTGRVVATTAFDTHGDEGAGQAMAAWIEAVPAGQWVLGAVKDEASLRLTEEAVAALRSLGVTKDLRGRFRWSHAFIGVKGENAGMAFEAQSVLRPASVAIGWPLTRPQVAAAVASIRLIPVENP